MGFLTGNANTPLRPSAHQPFDRARKREQRRAGNECDYHEHEEKVRLAAQNAKHLAALDLLHQAGQDARTAIGHKKARNQTPIMSEAKRGGASLVTMDRPTGDRHSSPQVCST